ncbi:MAG: hypothetical protein K1000chlam4_00918, partial [Chlamydiae bacterium]|nr:hypothetical protein [Chlamydiota bacterium]
MHDIIRRFVAITKVNYILFVPQIKHIFFVHIELLAQILDEKHIIV